jgi:WD40 repeat protein
MSRDTIVSAAIDSKIIAWNFKTGEIEATYTGHCNNKHFIGLSVGPKDVVACGSEDTRVYCYRRDDPENPICYTPDRYLPQGHGEVFCSAVAWQSVEEFVGDCHVLASAFSDGSISMLGVNV